MLRPSGAHAEQTGVRARLVRSPQAGRRHTSAVVAEPGGFIGITSRAAARLRPCSAADQSVAKLHVEPDSAWAGSLKSDIAARSTGRLDASQRREQPACLQLDGTTSRATRGLASTTAPGSGPPCRVGASSAGLRRVSLTERVDGHPSPRQAMFGAMASL